MPTLPNPRIRLALSGDLSTQAKDQRTGSAPVGAKASPMVFDFGLFKKSDGAPLDVSGMASILLEVIDKGNVDGPRLISKTTTSIAAVTQAAWDAGTGQNATITLTSTQTNLDFGSAGAAYGDAKPPSKTFYLVVSGVDTAGGDPYPLGQTLLTLVDPGTPASLPAPTPPDINLTRQLADTLYEPLGGGVSTQVHDVTNAQRLAGVRGDGVTPLVAGDFVDVTDQGYRREWFQPSSGSRGRAYVVAGAGSTSANGRYSYDPGSDIYVNDNGASIGGASGNYELYVDGVPAYHSSGAQIETGPWVVDDGTGPAPTVTRNDAATNANWLPLINTVKLTVYFYNTQNDQTLSINGQSCVPGGYTNVGWVDPLDIPLTYSGGSGGALLHLPRESFSFTVNGGVLGAVSPVVFPAGATRAFLLSQLPPRANVTIVIGF